ncbi:MAG: DUF1152 domain-containing protein [Candidatus Eremiobacteraeota bacterium]|nr:DUF1152 domain-containing protein [Candidatus Eremiobacteraeota bacterium]
MLEVPLLKRLDGHQRILLAGAGGGFDILSGLPLYFWLRARGKQVFLANLSFTRLEQCSAPRITPVLVEVGPDSDGPDFYFPERYLCQWLCQHEDPDARLYCFEKAGVAPLRQAYQALVDKLEVEALVLVDGGTDSLMRGDEDGLGTPSEDLASIAATCQLELPTRLLTCIGFGVDTFHGVCHHYFLEAVADLTRAGGFLGAFSLLPDFPESFRFKQALDYVHGQMPDYPSIVASSILSATVGRFGDVHSTTRTQGSELYINPLMSLYWSFELSAVAQRCLYLKDLLETDDFAAISLAIRRFRSGRELRGWKDLPV